jgi:hypothetical protein
VALRDTRFGQVVGRLVHGGGFALQLDRCNELATEDNRVPET